MPSYKHVCECGRVFHMDKPEFGKHPNKSGYLCVNCHVERTISMDLAIDNGWIKHFLDEDQVIEAMKKLVAYRL